MPSVAAGPPHRILVRALDTVSRLAGGPSDAADSTASDVAEPTEADADDPEPEW